MENGVASAHVCRLYIYDPNVNATMTDEPTVIYSRKEEEKN